MKNLRKMNKKLIVLIAIFFYLIGAIIISVNSEGGLTSLAYAKAPCVGCDGINVDCWTGGTCCESANSTSNDCHNAQDQCCPQE